MCFQISNSYYFTSDTLINEGLTLTRKWAFDVSFDPESFSVTKVTDMLGAKGLDASQYTN